MEVPYIPFMGDFDVTPQTQPSQLSPWLDENDKIPILLALSLYQSPISSISQFKLIENSNLTRAAAWFDSETGTCVIGLRGTSVGSRFGVKDLMDDAIIASGSYCKECND